MRALGFLCCLAGIFIAYPAILQWIDVISSMLQSGHVNPHMLFAAAKLIFETAALGEVLLGVGFLMILAF